MGHKYIKYDGEWNMSFRYGDASTVIRVCPKCQFAQPLDANMLGVVDFSKCPRCQAKLCMPKKIGQERN